MRDRIALVGTYMRLAVLNELQYRANFWGSLLEGFLGLAVALGSLAVIFGHTDNLAGWSAMELLALVGIYYIMSGYIQTFVQPSMERLLRDVHKGTLDFTLTKPEDAQLLVSVRAFAVWNLIYVLLGIAVVVFALARAGDAPSTGQIVAFVVTLLLGGVIVYSFWLMLATIAFWYIKIENILVIFQSMYEAGRWPVGIYPPVLRLMLTFLVPVAFAVTVPASALVGRVSGAALAGTLLAALGFFVAARLFWRRGVRAYAGASA